MLRGGGWHAKDLTYAAADALSNRRAPAAQNRLSLGVVGLSARRHLTVQSERRTPSLKLRQARTGRIKPLMGTGFGFIDCPDLKAARFAATLHFPVGTTSMCIKTRPSALAAKRERPKGAKFTERHGRWVRFRRARQSSHVVAPCDLCRVRMRSVR